jgi:hypothetical protein
VADEPQTPQDPLPFNFADAHQSRVGTPIPSGSPFYDFALLDTGAATHILRLDAANSFEIGTPFTGEPDGFVGENFQTLFGASGDVSLRINDPLGVFMTGLADVSSDGTALTVGTPAAKRGQSSVAMLQAVDDTWTLPNIIGLPMAAQHGIAIRNSEPVLMQHGGRTVRTPNIELIPRGSGENENILRRTELKLRPSSGFIQGPFYLQTVDFEHILSGKFHEDPLTPTVVENGGLFVEVDLAKGGLSLQDRELLLDTGADLTVLSRQTAKRLGFDALIDEPDLVLEVEGAGGVTTNVPVFHLDELNIDTIGGNFTLHNVPVAVLDLPNPNDPANVVPGILGMHLFNGRDIVIDANPAAGSSGGGPPTLYISDPVTEVHNWATSANSAGFSAAVSWAEPGTPNVMWDAQVRNVSGSNQLANVTIDATVNRLTISGDPGTAEMTVSASARLTTFGETLIEEGGTLHLHHTIGPGGVLDAQFVNIMGGSLTGEGQIFVGSGPIHGAVRNISGRVAPSNSGITLAPIGSFEITGDFANLRDGTLEIDLNGTQPSEFDRLEISRFAFLDGSLKVTNWDNGIDPFTPVVGDMFTIITAGEGVVGQFEHLILPTGFLWDVIYNPTSVVLSVIGLGLQGDYNDDGAVNAADYTVWRNAFGTSLAAADGDLSGTVDREDYRIWKNNFGRTNEGGTAGTAANVPEPKSTMFVVTAILFGLWKCRRSHG